MDIVPVIDLKGGVVVHARQGQRDSYRPIETPLSPTSAPADVIAGLLRLYPFRRFYVADLDAIEGRGGHDAVLAGLAKSFADLEFWIDGGIADLAAARGWLGRNAGALVIGSESQRDFGLLTALRAEPRVVLSLDFRGDAIQGPAGLRDGADLWPRRVIAMALARVGARQGPDLERVAEIVRKRGDGAIYAAGGVRDADDLRALERAGAAGALVATALHARTITAGDLAAWRDPSP